MIVIENQYITQKSGYLTQHAPAGISSGNLKLVAGRVLAAVFCTHNSKMMKMNALNIKYVLIKTLCLWNKNHEKQPFGNLPAFTQGGGRKAFSYTLLTNRILTKTICL